MCYSLMLTHKRPPLNGKLSRTAKGLMMDSGVFLGFLRIASITISAGLLSKASYLHGSFGSGKSHFMAVLHQLLQGHTDARSIPELAPVITKPNAWIAGKKFLLVPYHMIGAHDMESGILGGYVEFVRRMRPEAPSPGVYLAEGLFRDAENLRAPMGDARFFATLGEGASSGNGWGDLEASWNAERFEEVVSQSLNEGKQNPHFL